MANKRPPIQRIRWVDEKFWRTKLLKLARAYAEYNGIGMVTASRRLHGDHRFFRDFEKGRKSITLSKLDEIICEVRDTAPGVFRVVMGQAKPGEKSRRKAAVEPAGIELSH